jgi:AcrR family transcriptional regulator
MLEAAYATFAESGYSAATMQTIAARAGVATQTVYFSFNTKPQLFRAVISYASAGTAQGTPVRDRSWYREALSSTDAGRILELLVAGGSEIIGRLGPINWAIEEAAAAEPSVAVFQRDLARSRREGMRSLMERIETLGSLRPELGVDRATDIVFVLDSPDTLRRFAACGWSLDEWGTWTVSTLTTLILRRSTRRS